MPKPRLTYHQRYYKAHPEYQVRAKKWASDRYERIKLQGGDELEIMKLRKALYQRRVQIDKHLESVEYHEKHLFRQVEELQALLKRRRTSG